MITPQHQKQREGEIALFTIMKRRELNPTVTEFWVHAPLIAKKAKAGQFVIVRAKEDSERIPPDHRGL